ncbi:MAG: 4Fe-4S binding protein [Chloroflexi bacterium]|nr:4Fe-4S binding protein [Chloroflexota bacterium]
MWKWALAALPVVSVVCRSHHVIRRHHYHLVYPLVCRRHEGTGGGPHRHAGPGAVRPIVADRCVGCGLCAISCGRGVYSFDYERNVPVVVQPMMYMIGCTREAIEFPAADYVRQLVRDEKLLHQSKEMPRTYCEKYNTAQGEPTT